MRRLKGKVVKGQGRNPESLLCPSSTGCAPNPRARQRGGARSPWRLAGFSFKEGGGGIFKEQ